MRLYARRLTSCTVVTHIVGLNERPPGLAARRKATQWGASVQAVRTLTSRNLIFASSEFGHTVAGVFFMSPAKTVRKNCLPMGFGGQ